MIIIKGDIGIAINPIYLKIIPRQSQTIYCSYGDISKANGDIENNYGYCIQAVFENSESVVLSSKIDTIEEARKLLNELYKGIKA